MNTARPSAAPRRSSRPGMRPPALLQTASAAPRRRLSRRPPARRSSPLPGLLIPALLLFAAGTLAGWTGATVCARSGGNTLVTPQSGVSDSPASSPVSILDSAAGEPAADCWNLLLVNGDHPIPEDFAPPELTQLRNGQSIDAKVYPSLQRMMDDARAEGLQPLICSSYRSEETQNRLYRQKVQSWLAQGYAQEEAEEKAAAWVARPGASEHQIGLAVDIVDKSYQLLDDGQEHTAVQLWLMEHCADYGFILRYPTDKSALTGVGYEPWHYRYVGEEAAREIMGGGLCLEEYLARYSRRT